MRQLTVGWQRTFKPWTIVDGGINMVTAREVISADANVIVAGTVEFESSDIKRL